MEDIKPFLRNLPMFQMFTPPHLDIVAQALRVSNYPEGHQFTSQGVQGEGLYLLMEGNVKITERDDIAGLVREVKELHGGELFGVLSLLDDMPAAATCTAASPVRAASLPRQTFHELFTIAPPVGQHLLYMIAVQLARDLQNRNKSLRALLRREITA
jgi:CRP/FNR family cyclic AMP-dependent transcriptional regulator